MTAYSDEAGDPEDELRGDARPVVGEKYVKAHAKTWPRSSRRSPSWADELVKDRAGQLPAYVITLVFGEERLLLYPISGTTKFHVVSLPARVP